MAYYRVHRIGEQIQNGTELYHHGILGQKWGIRRFQNKDGSLTRAGEKRYGVGDNKKESLTEKYVSRLSKTKMIEKVANDSLVKNNATNSNGDSSNQKATTSKNETSKVDKKKKPVAKGVG